VTSPGGKTSPDGRRRAQFALALGAAAFALVLAVTSGAGPGLDPDAMAYLGATTSLVRHGTLRIPSSQWDATDSTSALTTWPPAFSIAMAVPRALGAGSLLSARIVNALAAFVTEVGAERRTHITRLGVAEQVVVHAVDDHASEGHACRLQLAPEEDRLVDRLALRGGDQEERRALIAE